MPADDFTCPDCDEPLAFLPEWGCYGCLCTFDGRNPSVDEIEFLADAEDEGQGQTRH